MDAGAGRTGELVDDPHEVAQIFSDLVAQVGLKRANRVGLQLNVDRAPTLEELQAALADRMVLRLNLLDRAVSALAESVKQSL